MPPERSEAFSPPPAAQGRSPCSSREHLGAARGDAERVLGLRDHRALALHQGRISVQVALALEAAKRPLHGPRVELAEVTARDRQTLPPVDGLGDARMHALADARRTLARGHPDRGLALLVDVSAAVGGEGLDGDDLSFAQHRVAHVRDVRDLRGAVDGPAADATFFQPNGIAASVTGDTLFVNSTRPVNDEGRLYPNVLRLITGLNEQK